MPSFLEHCYPQLISDKRNGWWTLPELMGHHLRTSWSWQNRPLFPEAVPGPGSKHLLPVSFLLLQRMIVFSLRNGQAPAERGSPSVVSSEWTQCLVKFPARGRMRRVGSALFPHSGNLYLTHIHRCTHLPTTSKQRRTCLLFQEHGAHVLSGHQCGSTFGLSIPCTPVRVVRPWG